MPARAPQALAQCRMTIDDNGIAPMPLRLRLRGMGAGISGKNEEPRPH